MSQAAAPPPPALPPDALLERLRWRYAVKRFDPARRVPAGTWAALEEVLRLSPSSFGLQPWRFVVVEDRALRERLRPVTWNQPQVTDASHLVVFAARRGLSVDDVERHVLAIARTRGVPRQSLQGYAETMERWVRTPPPGLDLDAWCARQAYIALGFFLQAAALLGVDACPMEGLDPISYDDILGLPALGYGTLCVATAGYRAADDAYAQAKKVRYPAEDVVLRR